MHPNKYDLVIDKMTELISNGTFKPEEKIYSENKLSNILGISRASIREVYAGLELLGVIRSRQGEGTYLSKSALENSSKALFLMTLLEKASTDEIMQIRKIIEVGAVELSAKNRSQEQVDSLYQSLEKLNQINHPGGFATEDVNFHSQIVQSTGNVILINLFPIISGFLQRVAIKHINLILQDQMAIQLIKEQHKAILEAIISKNGDLARLAMEKHLDFVSESLRLKECEGKKELKHSYEKKKKDFRRLRNFI